MRRVWSQLPESARRAPDLHAVRASCSRVARGGATCADILDRCCARAQRAITYFLGWRFHQRVHAAISSGSSCAVSSASVVKAAGSRSRSSDSRWSISGPMARRIPNLPSPMIAVRVVPWFVRRVGAGNRQTQDHNRERVAEIGRGVSVQHGRTVPLRRRTARRGCDAKNLRSGEPRSIFDWARFSWPLH